MEQKAKNFYPSIPYVIPFVVFLIFTGINSWSPLWLYPIKTIIVGLLLIYFRKCYTEIKLNFSFLTIVAGLLVFAIWIIPTYYPLLGKPKIINPFDLSTSRLIVIIWICFRILGASVVVPVMEELFWRSFLLRYLINLDFKSVPIGKFSWLSFLVTLILFGVEHSQWLAGIIAGIIYTLLLYRTKSIFNCIIAHAITNFVLGIYVIITQQWIYW